MKWLRWTILLLSILLVLAGGLLALAYWTPLGLRIGVSIAESQLDQQLQVEQVKGSPARGFELRGIHFQQPGFELELDQLSVKAAWPGLIGRNLTIESLTLHRLRIGIDPDPEPSSDTDPFDWREPIDAIELPVLPIGIELGELLITDIELRLGDQQQRIERLELQAGWQREQAIELGRLDLISLEHGELLLEARFDGARLDIERLRWQAPDEQQQVSLSGHIAPFGDQANTALSINWRDLEIPLPEQPSLWLPAGEAQISGWLQDYRLDLDTLARNPDHHGRLELSVAGDLEQLTIDRLRVIDGNRELIETASTRGQISWRDALEWQLRLDARALNIGVLLNDWPSDIDLDIETSGRLVQSTSDGRTDWLPEDLQLTIHRLQGELGEHSISGEGELSSDGSEQLSGDLRITSGDDRVRIRGTLAQASELTVELALPRIARWQNIAEGALAMELHIGGQLQQPDLRGRISIDELALPEQQLSLSRLQLNFDSSALQRGDLEVSIEQLLFDQQRLDQVQLSLAGDVQQHQLNLSLDHPQGKLQLALAGALAVDSEALDQSSWSGALETLDLELGEFANAAAGRWQMTDPAQLQLSAASQRAGRICLRRNLQQLCLNGEREESGALKAGIQLAGIELNLIEGFIAETGQPPAAHVRGQLQASASVDWDGQSQLPTLDLEISTLGAALSLVQRPDLGWLSIEPMQLNLRSEGDAAELTINAELEPRGLLAANVSIEAFNPQQWQDSRLDGSIELAVEDLAWLEILAPDLVNAKGRLASQWRLAGRLGDPDIAGEATLSDFSAEVPALALKLADGQIRLTSDLRAQQATLEGSIRSGDGQVELDGQLGLAPEDGLPLNLTVSGSQFTGMDTDMLRLAFSPSLTLQGQLTEQLSINGDLGIDRLAINLERLEAATRPSADVVIIDDDIEEDQADEDMLPLSGQIRIMLGDGTRVRLSGFGLQAGLGGNLNVELIPGANPIGRGQIRVDGSYESYGQDLQVSDGRLIYNAVELDNPSLDIRARRQVQEVTAGVHITGTARDPQAALYSDPANLSDADRLSYIVTGRPMSAVGEGGGDHEQQLASAALAYGISSASLPRRLGVDALEITDSPDLGGSSLLVGKQLSPRLMLSYVTSLFTNESMVQLRYQLSERWRLRVESATSESRGAIEYYSER